MHRGLFFYKGSSKNILNAKNAQSSQSIDFIASHIAGLNAPWTFTLFVLFANPIAIGFSLKTLQLKINFLNCL